MAKKLNITVVIAKPTAEEIDRATTARNYLGMKLREYLDRKTENEKEMRNK